MIILDTNVLSELMRHKPSVNVTNWVNNQNAETLFTTAITQAEILYGISIMSAGVRQRELYAQVKTIFEELFCERIISFDSTAAICFAEISSTRRDMGQPISQMDAQIAAIAKSRGAKLATRNVNDFQNCNLVLINPF